MIFIALAPFLVVLVLVVGAILTLAMFFSSYMDYQAEESQAREQSRLTNPPQDDALTSPA